MVSIASLAQQRTDSYIEGYLKPIIDMVKDRFGALASSTNSPEIIFEIKSSNPTIDEVDFVFFKKQVESRARDTHARRLFEELKGTLNPWEEVNAAEGPGLKASFREILKVIDSHLEQSHIPTILDDIDFPFNPMNVAIGSEAIFLGEKQRRVLDSWGKTFDDSLRAFLTAAGAQEDFMQRFEKDCEGHFFIFRPAKSGSFILETQDGFGFDGEDLYPQVEKYFDRLVDPITGTIEELVGTFNRAFGDDYSVDLDRLAKFPTKAGRVMG